MGAGPAPVCVRLPAEPRSLFRPSCCGGHLLPRKEAEEERSEEPDKHWGGERHHSLRPAQGVRGAAAARPAPLRGAAAAEGEARPPITFSRGRRRQREGDTVLCAKGRPISDALTEGLLQDATAFLPLPAGLNRDRGQLANGLEPHRAAGLPRPSLFS